MVSQRGLRSQPNTFGSSESLDPRRCRCWEQCRRWIGVGRTGCPGPPSLRTVRAVLPHTALQSVVLPVTGLTGLRMGFFQRVKPTVDKELIGPADVIGSLCWQRSEIDPPQRLETDPPQPWVIVGRAVASMGAISARPITFSAPRSAEHSRYSGIRKPFESTADVSAVRDGWKTLSFLLLKCLLPFGIRCGSRGGANPPQKGSGTLEAPPRKRSRRGDLPMRSLVSPRWPGALSDGGGRTRLGSSGCASGASGGPVAPPPVSRRRRPAPTR